MVGTEREEDVHMIKERKVNILLAKTNTGANLIEMKGIIRMHHQMIASDQEIGIQITQIDVPSHI
jgi:hypothetical protein